MTHRWVGSFQITLGFRNSWFPSGKRRTWFLEYLVNVYPPSVEYAIACSSVLVTGWCCVYTATTPLVWFGNTPDVLFLSITAEPPKMSYPLPCKAIGCMLQVYRSDEIACPQPVQFVTRMG